MLPGMAAAKRKPVAPPEGMIDLAEDLLGDDEGEDVGGEPSKVVRERVQEEQLGMVVTPPQSSSSSTS